jgi:hypothetical protein
MEIISILEFGSRTKDWEEITIDITPFLDEKFNCACGDSHRIRDIDDGLIRQLKGNRFVLRNRTCRAVSCFKFENISETIKLMLLYSAKL